jgi:hypothetical protein
MAGDWIKLHRKIIESRVFANNELLKLWVWCLARANWVDCWVPLKTGKGDTTVAVKRGQFIFGRKSAAKILKMKPRTLYDRMAKLEEWGNIAQESNTHYTLVTVCNYDTYQDDCEENQHPNRQPTANQPPTNRQPTANQPTQIRINKKNKKNQEGQEQQEDVGAAHPVGLGLDLADEIRKVFAHYRLYHPRAVPNPKSTSKEWRAIRARLSEGYSAEALCQAIDGCHKTPHNLGANERGAKYLGLELICRNSDQVTRFVEANENPPRPMNERERRTLSAAQSWIEKQGLNNDEQG